MANKAKGKGNAAFVVRRFEEAAAHFGDAIALAPDNHVLHSNRSAAYATLDRFADALADAERTVALHAAGAKGYSCLGMALLGLGEAAGAVEAYEQGLALDPSSAALRDGLAQARLALASALRPPACSCHFAAIATSKASKPATVPLDIPRNAGAGAGASSGRAEVREVAAACGMQEDARVPLSEMVLDCTQRWFQDALKEARAGAAAMQVLVGQMYRSGYGVNKKEHKLDGWIINVLLVMIHPPS